LGIEMSRLEFTPDEERAIKLFAAMPTGVGKRIHSWIAEVVPAVALLSYGLWTGRDVFTIAGFVPLILFSTLRIYRQFKYSQVIRSVFVKIQTHQRSANGAQPGAPPNGGPTTPLGSSEVTEGPPSVS
jgi:hypothetical protein